MEAVVTTGAIRHVQSSSQIVTISEPTPAFYRPDALPVAQPTVSKDWKETHWRWYYLDSFKPARPVLVVVDDGLVLTDHVTAGTLTDDTLRHTHQHYSHFTNSKRKNHSSMRDVTQLQFTVHGSLSEMKHAPFTHQRLGPPHELAHCIFPR